MIREDTWLEKRREKLWFSFLLNALILFVLLAVFRPVYETNDDMGIAGLVNMVKGESDAHVLFPHYLFGLLWELLYRLHQGVPWLPLFEYFCMFFSFTAITYVLIRKLKSNSSVWITAILVFWFSYEGYIQVQFTKTAGIVSTAGLLLLFYAVTQEKVSGKALVLGMLFSCTGFMFRKNQFFAEAALLTGIGVYLLLQLRGKGRKEQYKNFLLYFGTFGSLLIFVFALRIVNQQCYTSQEWQAFRRMNSVRRDLYDHGFPPYEENKEAYEELGIDEVSYRMLRSWNQMDTERFDVETLEGILALRQQKKLTSGLVKNFVREFAAKIFKVPCFYCFVLICIYWLLWGRHGKAELLALFYEALAVFLVYLYQYYDGRYLLNRVDVGLWLAVSCTVLWTFVMKEQEYFPARTGAALTVTVTLLLVYGLRGEWRVNAKTDLEKMMKNRSALETIHEDAEHVYVTAVKTVSFHQSYEVFEAVPFNMAENICPLGGWTAITPLYRRAAERYGITNPIKDVIGNEKAYLVTGDIDLMMEYIQVHYDQNAKAEIVHDFGKYKAYAIQKGD